MSDLKTTPGPEQARLAARLEAMGAAMDHAPAEDTAREVNKVLDALERGDTEDVTEDVTDEQD